MSAKWTNAAELARLAGVSRERVGQCLARGDIPEAVRVAIGERTAWRIPTRAASRFLKHRGIEVAEWVKRENAVGAMDDIFAGVPAPEAVTQS